MVIHMGTSTIHGGHEKMQLGENIIKLVMITPAARVCCTLLCLSSSVWEITISYFNHLNFPVLSFKEINNCIQLIPFSALVTFNQTNAISFYKSTLVNFQYQLKHIIYCHQLVNILLLFIGKYFPSYNVCTS